MFGCPRNARYMQRRRHTTKQGALHRTCLLQLLGCCIQSNAVMIAAERLPFRCDIAAAAFAQGRAIDLCCMLACTAAPQHCTTIRRWSRNKAELHTSYMLLIRQRSYRPALAQSVINHQRHHNMVQSSPDKGCHVSVKAEC